MALLDAQRATSKARKLAVAEWLAFDRMHKAPTFFARPAWAQAIAAATPELTPAPWQVPLGDGTVVLPLMESRLRGLHWPAYVGMPLGGYVVVMSMDGETAAADDILDAAKRLLDDGAASVAVTPWPLLDRELDPRGIRAQDITAEGPDPETMHCSVIDLRSGVDAALARMDSRARRNAGAAVRRGVTCAVETGVPAMRAYAEMLADAAARGRASAVPPAMLESLATAGKDDVEIWSARADGVVVAGGVVLYGSREAFYWSAAMREDAGHLRPSNLLNVDMLRRAAERGMQWFNLGASEGLPGVHRFKMTLGAVDVPYRTTKLESASYRAYSVLRRALGRSL